MPRAPPGCQTTLTGTLWVLRAHAQEFFLSAVTR